jgi:hypothetical protein
VIDHLIDLLLRMLKLLIVDVVQPLGPLVLLGPPGRIVNFNGWGFEFLVPIDGLSVAA